MSKAYRKYLERELKRIISEDSNGFVMNKSQELDERVKKIYGKRNHQILYEFSEWLKRFSINLGICSSREKALLMQMFSKERNGIERTRTERNTLKEVMNRC